MAKARLEIDEKALRNALFRDAGIAEAIASATEDIASRANSLGAPHPTGKWHDHEHGDAVRGPTTPHYKHSVRGAVGIIMPGNYAAMKDNAGHNTLLKAR